MPSEMRQPCHSEPQLKRFSSSVGEHVFVVDRSAIFDLSGPEVKDIEIQAWLGSTLALEHDELGTERAINTSPQSISLNVSSGCNLACTYCYASRGRFGGTQTAMMTEAVAYAAIIRLFEMGNPDRPFTIGFLGGEPLVNRRLVYQCIDFSNKEAAARKLDVRFSITTNGTLLSEADIHKFRRNRFAVTVSVDGGPEIQARMRPGAAKSKNTDFSSIQQRVAPLLADPGAAQMAARATVTRRHLALTQIFREIERAGFQEIGFSPLRANGGSDALGDGDWDIYLDELKRLASHELARALGGASIRLSNFAIALKQIHRGYRSPYPCGAGGGYFSVAANGDWYNCHRAIGNESYKVGDSGGPNQDQRAIFLKQRHVSEQTECVTCWAKYLCSGGCHQEAAFRTAASCNAIRSWLEYCLQAYVELTASKPAFFTGENDAK